MLTQVSQKPWLMVRFAHLFADLHTKIHQCDGSGLVSLRASLKATIEKVDTLPAVAKDRVLAILEALPDGNALCHFDFHPDQILITSAGPMVIDWMTAFRGDPAADVARTEVMARVAQIPYGSKVQHMIISLGRGQFNRIYLARYLKRNPDVRWEAIERWMVPVAAGRLNEKIPGEQEALLAIIRGVG
jgi:thiamine kinase-like enzyme